MTRTSETKHTASFVIPVFNSHGTLGELTERLADAMKSFDISWEVVYIVDGETPEDWVAYIDEIPGDRPVRAFRLSRNFGQHPALRLGIAKAQSGFVVLMDCDLQDPPEVIPSILHPLLSGQADVVMTRRQGNYDSISRQWLRHMYTRIMHTVTGLQFEESPGPVIGLSPYARELVGAFREDAHLAHILAWLDLPHVTIDYQRESRTHGRSSYSIRRRIRHAVRGLSFSSTRLIGGVFVASFVAAAAALTGLVALTLSLLRGSPPSGWLSLLTVTVLGFSLVGMVLSILGGLILEILSLVRGRPMTVIADVWPGRDE